MSEFDADAGDKSVSALRDLIVDKLRRATGNRAINGDFIRVSVSDGHTIISFMPNQKFGFSEALSATAKIIHEKIGTLEVGFGRVDGGIGIALPLEPVDVAIHLNHGSYTDKLRTAFAKARPSLPGGRG